MDQKINLFLLVAFISLVSSCGTCLATIVPPVERLEITEGQGFIVHQNYTDLFGELSRCTFQFHGEPEPTEIDLKSESSREIMTKRHEVIRRFSRQNCGIRVFNVTALSQGKWNLTSINKRGKKMKEAIYISVNKPPPQNVVREVLMPLGFSSLATINCLPGLRKSACIIRNEEKGIIHDSCMKAVTINGYDQEWECGSLTWGTMLESRETLLVKFKAESDYYNAGSYEETPDSIRMQCKFSPKILSRLDACKAIYPSGKKQILIREGLNSERFSAYNTSKDQARCVLEIKKPLRNDELGIWTITNIDSSTIPVESGCFFYVGNQQELIEERILRTTGVETIEVIVNEKETDASELEINCKAPFTLRKCYLKDPTNKIYFPDSVRFLSTRTVGLCNFMRLPEIPGLWSCGLIGKDFKKELTQEFEVVVISRFGETITEKLVANEGETVELLCRSAKYETISECTFIDPTGKVYYVADQYHEDLDSRVRYYGRGLKNGHCGVKIQNITKEDLGDWTCQFQSGRDPSVFKMVVEESPTSQALTIGLSVGLGVLAIVVISGIIFIFLKRRNLLENRQRREMPMDVQD